MIDQIRRVSNQEHILYARKERSSLRSRVYFKNLRRDKKNIACKYLIIKMLANMMSSLVANTELATSEILVSKSCTFLLTSSSIVLNL